MNEPVHRCPPKGEGAMPCCGRAPFEVPRTDRMTVDEALVTCAGRGLRPIETMTPRGRAVAADVRQQLAEALARGEDRARALLVEAQRTSLTLREPRLLGREIPGWHAWPDVEAMCGRELRLVERDRKVVQRHQREPGAWRGDHPACSHCKFWWPCPDIQDAVAVWVGTPEVDR